MSNAEPMMQVVVIEPRRSGLQLGLAELWAWRELLYFFVWRDLKVRYRQTVFGIAWALIQPGMLMLVFAVSVGQIVGLGPSGIPYPLFVLAGLVPWILFSQGVTGAANSLVGAEAVITKVYFPRLLLPFSSVVSYFPDAGIATIFLLSVQLVFGTAIGPIFLLPAMAMFIVVCSLGVGTVLSAVHVRYRDVRHALPFVIQLWFFASPVVYPSTLIPAAVRPLYALNPMVGAVEGFRWSVLGGAPPSELSMPSFVVGLLVFVAGLVYFRRVERTFADVI